MPGQDHPHNKKANALLVCNMLRQFLRTGEGSALESRSRDLSHGHIASANWCSRLLSSYVTVLSRLLFDFKRGVEKDGQYIILFVEYVRRQCY
ncbi:unnamed protein product, partial [Acanthoscelides obtectus]